MGTDPKAEIVEAVFKGIQSAFDARTTPIAVVEHEAIDLSIYDHIIVAFSGGKDSLACLLRLLDLGVKKEKIELWHHDVDGQEGSTLMDWPCTRDYCRAVAEAFGVKLYYSWKVGGFEREMNRKETPTAPIKFETPDGTFETGGKGPKGDRNGLFPQVSPDLSVRWCSAYLKIDVGAAALRNQRRFDRKKTLFVTGERAQESAARSKYLTFEAHRADLRDGRVPRYVDQWRAVHAWSEREVWAIIERYRLNPHPAYRLGWGRVSCAACIFGSSDQWASLRAVNPSQFNAVVAAEAKSGKTIKRKLSVVETADRGKPFSMNPADIRAVLSHKFDEPIIVDRWMLPAGAFGDSCGPT
ncbi:MAG: phosphoadenosine phosphosulfate reductase family protein [Tessaracoccus sp.]|uniref:phosphoadenosine phosphosulfate reductase family protein n=1 Tax=Tessaracoccus sp. TaxID=1971211 RepID=UPI001EC76FBE|nr:phosphoadenosine phosphosulfate reductase family protein [Tessaracoccus sp.]MBK7823280.1 phosphoadenosine phosphosulfate reductase family protein [Tessaracoccus sp.]